MASDFEKKNSVDKSGWDSGPWMNEPDRVEFYAGRFPALIRRVPTPGHLCGYLAVPPGHPWHGKNYDEFDADVHGGLTYAQKCEDEICHVPRPGEPDDVWWIGFDCSHAYDYRPGDAEMNRRIAAKLGEPAFRSWDGGEADVYRTVDYVRAQIERLAEQAEAAR